MLKQFVVLMSLFALTFCFCSRDSDVGVNVTPNFGNVIMYINVDKIPIALHKTKSITVSKLLMKLTNNAIPSDTVNDTSSINITQGNSGTVTKTITGLKALKTWKVVAWTKDLKDSVIHKDSASFIVLPSDTAKVTLNLSALFGVYEADFKSIPDTVTSSTGEKSSIKVDSLVVMIDGNVVADSAKSTGFVKGSTIAVSFDYVRIGSHTILLKAFGTINTYSGLLFSGISTIVFLTGIDNSGSITMNWVGPTTGTSNIQVVIGRVGKIITNGTLPGTILQ